MFSERTDATLWADLFDTLQSMPYLRQKHREQAEAIACV